MRKWAVLIMAVLALALLGLLTVQWLQRTLLSAGVEQLHWQQPGWHQGALQVGQLNVEHVSALGRLSVHVDGLSVRPGWDAGPYLEVVQADALQVQWQPAESPVKEPVDTPWTLPSLADFADYPGWLPRHIQVHQLQVQLPCTGAYCLLEGSLGLENQPQPLRLDAQLALEGQAQQVAAQLQLRELAGRYLLQVSLDVPQPLPLAGLGAVSGNLIFDLENQGNQWLVHDGRAAGRLQDPQLEVLTALPARWRPEVLALQLDAEPGNLADWQEQLRLAMQVQVEGDITGKLQGTLALSSQPAWQVELDEGHLHMAAEQLRLPDIALTGVELNWPLHILVDAQQAQVELGTDAAVAVGQIALPGQGLILQQVQGQLGMAQMQLPLAAPEQISLNSPLRLTVQQLQHAALKPREWTLQGHVQQSVTGLHFDGHLGASSGLGSQLQLDWPAEQDWQLQAKLDDMFLRAANPLADTVSDWPALLSFSSGRLTGQMQVSGRDTLRRLTGQVALTGAEGIYDRTSFSGLTLPLAVDLQGNQLRLVADGVELKQLDPGLELGPIRARGRYSAALDQLTRGVIELQQGAIAGLDGQVTLEPAQINLGQSRQSLVAVVEGVELARLFEVYPAEGLSGNGILDGRFPVSLEDGKLLIEDGLLQARQPGGVLRYQTPELHNLAATNPNLGQLTAALDDFHYQVLASDVSYDGQGVLVLGLRLEGRNPAFQQGRQVNLNIRLEEDIPALLTSLQLSGQVDDIIRKRIEQRYIQRSSQ